MRCVLFVPLLAGLLAGDLPAATIQFQVSDLGANQFHITYLVSGFTFALNQELDIQFDQMLFSAISNGTAPAGFDVLLEQPNNPPGTPGDFSAESLVASPGTGPFGVNVVFTGFGRPGSQQFFINQLDQTGVITGVLASGSTVASIAAVPEPATLPLAGLGLLTSMALLAVWRRLKPTA